jgi:hypothetical protein
MNVVFTGPAFDNGGNTIVRDNLIAACMKKGNLDVQPRVKATTNMAIASRLDTVKAKRAAQRGLAVMSYPEFINKFLRGVDVATGGKPNHYTDKIEQDLLVPDFTSTDGLDPQFIL